MKLYRDVTWSEACLLGYRYGETNSFAFVGVAKSPVCFAVTACSSQTAGSCISCLSQRVSEEKLAVREHTFALVQDGRLRSRTGPVLHGYPSDQRRFLESLSSPYMTGFETCLLPRGRSRCSDVRGREGPPAKSVLYYPWVSITNRDVDGRRAMAVMEYGIQG